MKKVIIFAIMILLIGFIVEAVIFVKINNEKALASKNISFNNFFEKYKDKKLYGTDVLTIINKIKDINNDNASSEEPVAVEIIFITTDEKGNIIEKSTSMENLEKAGLDNFIASFSITEFECKEIQYNTNNRISKIIIRQTEI